MPRPKMIENGRSVKVYLPAKLIRRAAQAARARTVSMSGLIRSLLEERLELKKEKEAA